ncbi:big defensin-like [Pecten maximus]|uniref:big defensin-like n=1 Tax=Pecten maximus TaxID=6579 RepID=UPI001458C210|nr:big defensin-like [Pecten maximus]
MAHPSLVRCCSLFYLGLILMAIVCPAYSASVPERDRSREKRAIPLMYVGQIVAPYVFRALVAAYGAAVVAAAGVKLSKSISSSRDNDNHSCRGNSGWCRSSCYRREREYRGNLGVCGSYKCCVTKSG